MVVRGLLAAGVKAAQRAAPIRERRINVAKVVSLMN
jgi:hypothetical protein